MRVAICISGQSRDVKNTIDNIKNCWQNYDQLDFFVHTWINPDRKPFRPDTPSDFSENDIDLIIDRLIPKSILVEYPKKFNKEYVDSTNWGCYHPTKNPNPSQNIQSMFYSICMANSLKKKYELENNFTYDCVIRCRFDYFFTKKYDLKTFDLNSLNTKSDCTHTEYAINDHLALSNSKIMDKYCDVFFNLEEYYKIGIEFNPEVILGYHILNNNIGVIKSLGSDESYVSTKQERERNINV